MIHQEIECVNVCDVHRPTNVTTQPAYRNRCEYIHSFLAYSEVLPTMASVHVNIVKGLIAKSDIMVACMKTMN